MEDGHARESVVSDGHRLDLVAIPKVGHERDDAVLRKMREANGLIGLPYDLPRLDRHHLGSFEHSLDLVWGQKPEDFVPNAGVVPARRSGTGLDSVS